MEVKEVCLLKNYRFETKEGSVYYMTNIFIEGIPGSGKSTLLKKLQENLPEYKFYFEGDISPVELAWCSYMTEKQYKKAVEAWPGLENSITEKTKREGNHYIVSYTRIHAADNGFYQYMEGYEVYGGRRSIEEFTDIIFNRFQYFHETGNVFECSFFQNIIEELMLFAEYDDEQILDFYRKLLASMNCNDFVVIRLLSTDIKNSIEQIRKERVDDKGEEVWYRLMTDYLNKSPYGKAHAYNTIEDLVNHFNRRISLESRILEELFQNRYIDLESKNYHIEDIISVINR